MTELENTLTAAFAQVLARLDNLDRNGNAQPPAAVVQPPAPVPAPAPREPKLTSPKAYEGEFDLCRGFLVQCELVFRHQPSRYLSDGARIAFIMNLLTGKALKWATAALDQRPSLSSDYAAFCNEFKSVFDHPVGGSNASGRLHTIRQGSRTVAEYTVDFRVLAAECRWNDEALLSAYRRGLSEEIKDGLYRDWPETCNELIDLALKMDQRLQARREERTQRQSSSVSRVLQSPRPSAVSHSAQSAPLTSSPRPPEPGSEPMEVARSRLTTAQREERMRARLCLYCGQAGHFIKDCATRPKDRAY